MTNKTPLIRVTGATGAVGPRVVVALYDAGYSIRTLSIDPPPVGTWPDDVETIIGDVTDVSVLQATIQDKDAVVCWLLYYLFAFLGILILNNRGVFERTKPESSILFSSVCERV